MNVSYCCIVKRDVIVTYHSLFHFSSCVSKNNTNSNYIVNFKVQIMAIRITYYQLQTEQ